MHTVRAGGGWEGGGGGGGGGGDDSSSSAAMAGGRGRPGPAVGAGLPAWGEGQGQDPRDGEAAPAPAPAPAPPGGPSPEAATPETAAREDTTPPPVDPESRGDCALPPPAFLPGDGSSSPKHPATALASYPGSGSTLTRLLLELATGYHTGSVYGDRTLLENPAHPFLGEYHRTNVTVVKTHFPAGSVGTEFEFREARRVVLLLRDPRRAIPSYGNYEYGKSHGSEHGMQAPEEEWVRWRDHGDTVGREMGLWAGVVGHWTRWALAQDPADISLHVVRYEDLVGEEGGAMEAMRSLVDFLGYPATSSDQLLCALGEALGRKSSGIHRERRYVPGYTAEQEEAIAGKMRELVEGCGFWVSPDSSSSLCRALESYLVDMGATRTEDPGA